MSKVSNTNYGLVVALNDTDMNAVTSAQAGGQSISDKLSMVAGSLLRDLARGGTMIAPEWTSRIEQAIGTTDVVAIVEHVEKAVSRIGESTIVPWIVDPTQISFYRMQAENAGISLEMQLKAHLDNCYAQGFMGLTAPDPFKLLLSPEQYRYLQELFEKDIVTGDDVIARLAAVGSAESDDLIMESLGGK